MVNSSEPPLTEETARLVKPRSFPYIGQSVSSTLPDSSCVYSTFSDRRTCLLVSVSTSRYQPEKYVQDRHMNRFQP